MDNPDKPASSDLRLLKNELARLNENQFFQMHRSLGRMLWTQLLKGIALGLGTVIGATLVVSVAVFVLTNIDFIPIIGEWAVRLADEMKQPR